MTNGNLMQPTANTRAVSVREKSTPDLIQAIRSPGDEQYILDRIRTISENYYQPEKDELAKAAAFDEYRKPLRDFPRWAVAKAFDEWVKTGKHRPTPAHLRILAENAMRPLTEEIARRERAKREQDEAMKPRDPQIAEKAERIAQAAGFNARRAEAVKAKPMATSEAELYGDQDQPSQTHWTEKVSRNSPQYKQLIAARMNNPLMRPGMLKSGHMDEETQEDRAFRLMQQERAEE